MYLPTRGWNRARAVVVCGIAAMATPAVRADDSASALTSVWPDSFVSRIEALALLETFNDQLLTHDSATLTLERWCDSHRLAAPARIVAERVSDSARDQVAVDKPLLPDQRRELGVSPKEPIRYRRVRLRCGPVVLSEADNWYVPARLTPEMNRQLDTSDVPFGKVVQALNFQRRTLSSKLLWLPLPDGWEMTPRAVGNRAAGAAALVIPHAVLEQRAVLTLPDGTPISEVVETYTSGILAFPPPSP
jgi:chorismate-pyruvate lyase